MLSHNPETAFLLSHTRLHTRLAKRIDGQLSYHGISFTEFTILHQLHGADDKTMRRIDLAESVGITASGVTRVIAPMHKIGLVQKEANPRDARVSLVKLSKAGQTLYEDASVTLQHAAKTLLEPLTERQLEQLADLTDRLM